MNKIVKRVIVLVLTSFLIKNSINSNSFFKFSNVVKPFPSFDNFSTRGFKFPNCSVDNLTFLFNSLYNKSRYFWVFIIVSLFCSLIWSIILTMFLILFVIS